MSEVDTLELLKRIDQRLERLEAKVAESTNEISNGASILLDSIDSFAVETDKCGVSNVEKLQHLEKLFLKLTEKESIKGIECLVDNLKHVNDLADKVKTIEDSFSMLVDSTDEFFAMAMERNLDIEAFFMNFKKLSYHILDLFESGALNQLVESGILDSRSIDTVGALGKSMAVSSGVKVEVGPLKAMSFFFNKDFQRAMGFAMNFASHFGRRLDTRTTNKQIKNTNDIGVTNV